MSVSALSHAQFLWLMVGLELLVFAAIWLVTAYSVARHRGAMQLFTTFNLCLATNVGLVVLRGSAMPEALTRVGASLIGLAGFVALWIGSARLLKTRLSVSEPALVLALGSAGILGFGLVPGQGSQRVAAEFLVLAWIGLRAAAAFGPLVRARYGRLPAELTRCIIWGFSAVILVRALGALALGWRIEAEHDTPDTLAFIYFVLAGITSLNAMLAFMFVRSLVSELEAQAQIDPLTGLLNRRSFTQRQTLYWERWQRRQQGFAVVCLDIDHFKQVNDRHGHSQGDQALVSVAGALRDELRPMDTLARTGGEEFTVLLDAGQTVDAQGEVPRIAERLRQAVQALRPWPDTPERTLTVSLGVALSRLGDRHLEAVITRADDALYQAKARGRNRVVLAPELASTAEPAGQPAAARGQAD